MNTLKEITLAESSLNGLINEDPKTVSNDDEDLMGKELTPTKHGKLRWQWAINKDKDIGELNIPMNLNDLPLPKTQIIHDKLDVTTQSPPMKGRGSCKAH